MPRNYIPKKSFFESTRIHKIAKDLIGDCKEDRKRALDTFVYFQTMVSSNPEDDKAKSEMIHALGLSQDANDKIVKILDMMIKMTSSETKKSAASDTFSFESLRQK